jgi:hypothetical protein
MPEAELVDTDVIDPEVVERAPQPSSHEVIDADVVEDETYPAPSVSPATPPELPAGPSVDAPPSGERAAPPAGDQPAPPAGERAAPRRERPTRGDLRLLRQDAALRARAVAALVVPFVLYTVVLAIIGRIDVYLYWIWIPAVLAGVLFGAQLDAAARRTTGQGTINPDRPAP